MKRLNLTSQSSTTPKQLSLDTYKDRKKARESQTEYKVSVIEDKNSIEKFILKHNDENIDKNQKEKETQSQGENNHEKTQTLSIRVLHQEKKQEMQATLKNTPTSHPAPRIDQENIPNPLPSENKSAPIPKEQIKEKIKLARDRQNQKKQWRDLNQMFVINRKLISEQKELTISDTKVFFPYEPYNVQVEYMKNVLDALKNSSNAVLQSPTGTGKTLCLLASVLSFVEKQFRGQKLRHNVIYMSRTHSQLRQVQKELSKTCYRPNMAIFASRDQLCLKDNLAMLKGKEKIEACGKGVKLARRMRKQSGEISTNEQDPKSIQAVCEFYREREEVVAIGRRKLANTLLDIDIMRQVGREQMFCPYFYPIQTKDFTTLFIMPYNYLLDSYLLNSYQEIIENSIIIFDEAHNIAQAACQGRSLILQTHNFDSALLELNKLLSKYVSPSLQGVRARYDKEIKYLVEKIEDFKETFRKFIEEMFSNEEQDRYRRDTNNRDEGDVRLIGKERTDYALFQLFSGGISDDKRRQFEQRKDYYKSMMISKLILPMEQFTSYGVILIEQLKDTPDGVFSNFERVLIFILKVKSLLAPKINKPNEKTWLEDELNHFRLYVNKNSSGLNGTINYTVGLRCLVPWLTFKDILRFKPRSILLTSGTLKPLNMWQKQLKLKFNNQLVNKHVINQEQIAARVIKSGPAQTRFTFTYDNLSKNRNQIYKDLIQFLIQAASRIPNGILLVFPSFKIQMDFKYELMRSSKKERLTAFKDIIFEERSMDINMNDFKKKALSSKGAILAIICRGKVSQGIDFPDGMCRAVFIVGIPYPNIRDPFIIEKKNHLENIASRCADRSLAISGEQWYFMGTIRAINQALGRVIRHAMDYGMVFLIDSRYCDNKMVKELPGWISQSMEVVDHLQSTFYNSIHEFYQNMKQKYKPKNEEEHQEEKQEQVQNNALNVLMGNRKRMRVRRRRREQESLDF